MKLPVTFLIKLTNHSRVLSPLLQPKFPELLHNNQSQLVTLQSSRFFQSLQMKNFMFQILADT
ncbi:hypothetical protein T09_14606 [Trichinella sp. T9]|nr:hypothetical protein T09_14606 [Trichinella sp. T9]